MTVRSEGEDIGRMDPGSVQSLHHHRLTLPSRRYDGGMGLWIQRDLCRHAGAFTGVFGVHRADDGLCRAQSPQPPATVGDVDENLLN